MTEPQLRTFPAVLDNIMSSSYEEWVYFPKGEDWDLNSRSVTLKSDEVPEELENEPDAGVPVFAKQRGLRPVVPVATLQDIVFNAQRQVAEATPEQLFAAFQYYFDNDAFIELA